MMEGRRLREERVPVMDLADGRSTASDPEDVFRSERARLMGLTYRMLGSVVDAEDVVQEAWLRWNAADQTVIERPAAWLTTVTSRLAIDRLRSQRRRREEYVGPWLPDPISTVFAIDEDAPGGSLGPERSAEMAESLELGFLVVLDALGPVERAVFLLADVFAVPFAEIAVVVDRTPEACRQVASRARRKVREERSDRRAVDEGLLGDLVAAIALGDIERVVSLLSPDVVLTSDGGPLRHAARRPVVFPDRVARLLVNLGTRISIDSTMAIEQVNHAPALVIRSAVETLILMAEREPVAGAVVRIQMVLNPDKLAGIHRSVELI